MCKPVFLKNLLNFGTIGTRAVAWTIKDLQLMQESGKN